MGRAISSFIVMGCAVASALTAAWGLNRLGDGGYAQAAPAHAPAAGEAVHLRRGADGHYWAEALIDGRSVRLMVDTGATLVALTPEDAARLGAEPADHDYSRAVQTASGRVRAAPVVLASVSIAGARMEGVEALVVETGLPHSLLGMSFLGRLSGFEATPSGLTLKP